MNLDIDCQHIPFVPENLPGYLPKQPPAVVPVVYEDKAVCTAIYYDSKYSFTVPPSLREMLGNGPLQSEIVYKNLNGVETFQYYPGSQVVWIKLSKR